MAAIDYMRDEIHRAAYRHQRAVESGELEVVGVNVHTDPEPVEAPTQPDYARLAEGQRGRLAGLKAGREPSEVDASLARIRRTAAGDANLLPVLIDAVRHRVTLGEMSHALRDVWGEHRPR